ncbi:MAG: disulfide bond formation protein B [Verrucomicrobia bacterium]|nr:disulfide bond formation protein B [Verrucomicrobiota bacterium]MBS0645816.1 disulfide bond formation protein B [Verrucomicrobiota bacterium]
MKVEKFLCSLEVVVIAAILLGALAIQYFKHETPCPMCFLQRLSMIGVGTSILLNVRFKPQKRHYGLALFFAILGGTIALRQIALHACPNFPTFGIPFWGLSLYTWSFLVFTCTVGYTAMLFILFDRTDARHAPTGWLGHIAFILLFLTAALNIFASLDVCGFGACG